MTFFALEIAFRSSFSCSGFNFISTLHLSSSLTGNITTCQLCNLLHCSDSKLLDHRVELFQRVMEQPHIEYILLHLRVFCCSTMNHISSVRPVTPSIAILRSHAHAHILSKRVVHGNRYSSILVSIPTVTTVSISQALLFSAHQIHHFRFI